MTIHVLIADDSRPVREGLTALFSRTEIQVAAVASTGKEAVCLVHNSPLDVVLLDIRMPGGNGFQTLRQIKAERPQLAVVMHSTFYNPHVVIRCREDGANGYVVKGGDPQHLIETIRAAAKGKILPPIAE